MLVVKIEDGGLNICFNYGSKFAGVLTLHEFGAKVGSAGKAVDINFEKVLQRFVRITRSRAFGVGWVDGPG